MFEQNYLEYPQAVKEAMGQKVDWEIGWNEEEPVEEVEQEEVSEEVTTVVEPED